MLYKNILGGFIVHNLNSIISYNLARLRQQKNLSLDGLAKLSGVSKAMIAQIERGESSPTVNTLWKIATGLHVPFGTLIATDKQSAKFVQFEEKQPLHDTEGFTLYPIFSFEDNHSLEIFSALLAPHCSHASDPHGIDSFEYILPISGELQVGIQGEVYALSTGSSLQIDSNYPHSYHNPSDTPAAFYCILQHRKI